MQNVFTVILNMYYKWKGFKKVSESKDNMILKCLKCGTSLPVQKNYGVMHVLCGCGHSIDINTGKDIHTNSKKEISSKQNINPEQWKYDKEVEQRNTLFKKHINSDLQKLCELIAPKRNITIQVDRKNITNIVFRTADRKIYEDAVKYLQDFCDLGAAHINCIWEPLEHQNTLSDTKRETNILGTTYTLPMGHIIYYTIYLNQKYANDMGSMLSTVAHELSHIYASYNRINFISPDNDRGNSEYNEQMTDLLGIVLGMGKIMATSMDSNESLNTVKSVPSKPVIPLQASHLFRWMQATHSGASQPVIKESAK